MWGRQQILALKNEAYPFHGDDYVWEHFIALNMYFNRYVMEKLTDEKNMLWQAMELEAELIAGKLALLTVEV